MEWKWSQWCRTRFSNNQKEREKGGEEKRKKMKKGKETRKEKGKEKTGDVNDIKGPGKDMSPSFIILMVFRGGQKFTVKKYYLGFCRRLKRKMY